MIHYIIIAYNNKICYIKCDYSFQWRKLENVFLFAPSVRAFVGVEKSNWPVDNVAIVIFLVQHPSKKEWLKPVADTGVQYGPSWWTAVVVSYVGSKPADCQWWSDSFLPQTRTLQGVRKPKPCQSCWLDSYTAYWL